MTPMEELEKYIADMPGGSYIGDKWKKEPLVMVVVNGDDTDAPLAYQVIKKAYPPKDFVDDIFGECEGYVVPKTVADMLTWYQDFESYSVVEESAPQS